VIPKRIIQTGPLDLSLGLRAGMMNVRLLNPEFEYMFFDDAKVESFVQEQCQEWRNAYQSLPFEIQRFDLFRYMAVYRYGGFYLDLDVFLAEALTQLLSSECVFSFEELTDSKFFWDRFQMDWQIANYAFGAEPNHPFLASIIDNCLRAQRDPSWVKPMMKWIPKPFYDEYYILNTTGPGLVSRTYGENPSIAERVHVLFPYDVRDPRTWHQFGTLGVHDMVGSWRPHQNLLARRLRRVWSDWRHRRALSMSRKRGATRETGLKLSSDRAARNVRP
jgi:inositol phosphorylceramide mannosyltransferase catalytic subunit